MRSYGRVAVTGGYGFLGWHTACRLRARHGVDVVRLGRKEFEDSSQLDVALRDVDAVVHVAGINRAATDSDVELGNVELASTLANALERQGRPIDVAYANSVQAMNDSPYGRGKQAASEILGKRVLQLGATFADLLLPNLFGEHGRPNYNSFVATFVHEVAAGRQPLVTGDREIPLLHAQGAAEALLDCLGETERRVVPGEPVEISAVLRALREFHDLYAGTGEIPDISEAFRRDLFNTYRSALFPGAWPMHPRVHSDERGDLYEAFRSHGGPSMGYLSTTRPGRTRGEHYHLHKVERFLVVKGQAEISLRRLLTDERVTFLVSGEEPAFIDMPTMWVHNIRNIGDGELVTMFWSDQLLNAANPDQFPERVMVEEER